MSLSKKDALREAFLRGEHITPLIALNRYRLMCLSQRVGDFRNKEGLNIKDRFVPGQPYKEYWLEQQPEQLPLELAA